MATNFLWYAGASANSGLVVSAVSLMTTELKSITNASVIVSSVNGSSGLFTNSNTGQAIFGDIFYSAGNLGMTPTAGGNWAGWFLTSLDGGTTFESTTNVPARPPDFLIPLPARAITTELFKASGLVRLPALQFKVLMQNNSGVTSGAGATTSPFLKLAPVAMQY